MPPSNDPNNRSQTAEPAQLPQSTVSQGQPIASTQNLPGAQSFVPEPKKHRKLVWLLILLVLAFIIGGIYLLAFHKTTGSGVQTSATQSSGTQYTNPKYGYKITPPKDWTLVETDSGESWMSPGSSGANLTTIAGKNDGSSLKQFYDLWIDPTTQNPNYKVLDYSQATVNGHPVYLLDESSTDVGTKVSVRTYTLLEINNSVAYIISGEAAATDWATYSSTIKSAVSSFQP